MVWPGAPADKNKRLSLERRRLTPATVGPTPVLPFSIHSADRGGRAGSPVSRLSRFFAPFREIASTTIVTIGKLPIARCRRLGAVGRMCSRQLRSNPREQYAQLGRLRLGDSKM